MNVRVQVAVRCLACEMLSSYTCGRSYVVSSLTFYVASISSLSRLYIPYLLQIGGLCLFIYVLKCPILICIPVFICVQRSYLYVYVCVSVCAVQAHSSATKCCCVVALLPLPQKHCSSLNCCCPTTTFPALFFLSDSELGPLVPPDITLLPPTGCWQFCGSRVIRKKSFPVDRLLNRNLLHSACRLSSGNPSQRHSTPALQSYKKKFI